jgi:hypothetical protein
MEVHVGIIGEFILALKVTFLIPMVSDHGGMPHELI